MTEANLSASHSQAAGFCASAVLPASFQLGQAWFVFIAESRGLRLSKGKFEIEHAIGKVGFKTFMPIVEVNSVCRGRRVKIAKSAFGYYGFVKFDRERDDWGSLRAYDPKDGAGLRGFVSLLANNGFPLRVPDLVMERLQRMAELGLFSADPLQIGAEVEIMEGPFAGIVGKILSCTKQRRVKLLPKILGSLEIDACFLRKM